MIKKDKSSPEFEVRFGNISIRMKETVSIIVALIGLIAGISTVLLTKLDPLMNASVDDRTKAVIESLMSETAKSYKNELEFLRNKLVQTETLLTDLNKVPDEAKVAAQLNQQKEALVVVSERLNKMEKAVLEDPAKALEMPLLRKDFNYLKQSYETDSLALRNEVSRIYDLNKWFIGLMFSMAIGLIGLAITNFLKSSKKDES
jgi:hypothetical protein